MSFTYTKADQNLTYNLPNEGEVFKPTGWNNNGDLYKIQNGQVTQYFSGGFHLNTDMRLPNGTIVPAGSLYDQATMGAMTPANPNFSGSWMTKTGLQDAYDQKYGTGSFAGLGEYNMADVNQAIGLMKQYGQSYGSGSVPVNDPTLAGYVNPNANFQNTGSTAGFTQAPTMGIGGITYNANLMNSDYQPQNATPPVSAIPSTIQAGNLASGTFTSPPASAPAVADQFNTSLATTLTTQQSQLQQSLQSAQQSYQTKIDQLNQQLDAIKQNQKDGMEQQNSLVTQETQAKQDALQQEQQQFQDNYNARQSLVGRLGTLLTTGQQIIEQMKGTTGLASIMNPRISQTMADVQGEAGVITAALSAYDSQIGLAQSQLTSSLNAIHSIYGDQLNYWQSVTDFYANQQKDVEGQVATLTKDQQQFIDTQIQTLQDGIKQTQQTAQLIQKAMLDPNTALVYAKAGVSLTDSPAQINQKLATVAYANELSNLSNDMAAKGYSSTPITGVSPVTVVDSQGQSHAFYAATKPGTKTGTGSTGGSTSTFTTAQSNKGAVNAGMSIADFGKLAADDQNFFINGYAQFQKDETAIANGTEDKNTVANNIRTSNLSQSVKDLLLKKLGVTDQQQSSGGFSSWLGNIWKTISGA